MLAVICIFILMMGMSAGRAFGATDKTWQPGTVTQVKAHQVSSTEKDAAKQYDVSVQVGQKIYVTSYKMKDDEPDLQLYVGMARMVLIDGETLTFNDLLGHPHSMKIVSSRDAAGSDAK
jgi:hypothetical protein